MNLRSLPQLHVTRMHFVGEDGRTDFGQVVYETDDGFLVLRGRHAQNFALGLAAGRGVPIDVYGSWDEWRAEHVH